MWGVTISWPLQHYIRHTVSEFCLFFENSTVQPDPCQVQVQSHSLRRTQHGLAVMRSLFLLCFFCAPQVEDCATRTVNGAWNSAKHALWIGQSRFIFRPCGTLVQCIVRFTVLVRPNKVWYNWQQCFSHNVNI